MLLLAFVSEKVDGERKKKVLYTISYYIQVEVGVPTFIIRRHRVCSNV